MPDLRGVTAAGRVGIDSVDIGRVERLLREAHPDDLGRLFSGRELEDCERGERRAASLAGRLAAKEACLKLFPREAALGLVGVADFNFERDGYGAPRLVPTPVVQQLLDRHRIATIAVSLTHEGSLASAVAAAEPAEISVPAIGRWIYRWLPIRGRLVLENLRRAFGESVSDAEIQRLAEAHYAHLARLVGEFVRLPWLGAASRAELVRIENIEAILAASKLGKGILVLAGHCGNWEVATVAGIGNFPEYRGRFHVVRRALRPKLLDRLVTARFRRAGLVVLSKTGSLDRILDRLAANDAVVFVLDQHAGGRDGIAVEFFGQPAWTFRSLAILALASGAPVVPATSWREPDGRHVLRFEEALPTVHGDDADAAIRENTRAYNAALERMILRHPEQWFWIHRRWKDNP